MLQGERLPFAEEAEGLFGVRPEKVTVSRKQPDGVGNDVKGVVRDVSFLGVATSYLVDMPSGTTWSCYEQNLDVEPLDLRPGDEVWLTWNPGHAFGVPVEEIAGLMLRHRIKRVPVLRLEAEEFSQVFSSAGQSEGLVAMRLSVLDGRRLLGQKSFLRRAPALALSFASRHRSSAAAAAASLT